MLPPLFVSFFVFTFVFLLAKIMELTELVAAKGVAISQVLMLLIYTLPVVIGFTLPMATLLATLLAFLRLSSENELTALKSSGVGLYQMLPPVIALTLATAVITAVMTMWGQPLGWHAFENLATRIVQAKPRVTIKERVFREFVENVNRFWYKRTILRIDTIDPDSAQLNKVFISIKFNKQHPTIKKPPPNREIIAKRGRMVSNPDGRTVTLLLFDGIIQTIGKDKSDVNTIRFKTSNLVLDMGRMAGAKRSGPKHPKEMVLGELFQAVDQAKKAKRRRHIQIELNQRFSVPFACLILGLLGVPLGMQTKGSGRLSGAVMALVIFVVYYLFMSSAFAFGKSGALPPAVGVWLPNVVFAVLMVYMVNEAAKDRPIVFVRIVNAIMYHAKKLVSVRKQNSHP